MNTFKQGDIVVYKYNQYPTDDLITTLDLYQPQTVRDSYIDEDGDKVIELVGDDRHASWSSKRFELVSEWEKHQRRSSGDDELQLCKNQVRMLQESKNKAIEIVEALEKMMNAAIDEAISIEEWDDDYGNEAWGFARGVKAAYNQAVAILEEQ